MAVRAGRGDGPDRQGEDGRDKIQFDQWRPYVTMMHARAAATPLIEAERYAEGIQAIDGGIEAIRQFLDEYQQAHRAEECAELVSLQRWRDEIRRLSGLGH